MSAHLNVAPSNAKILEYLIIKIWFLQDMMAEARLLRQHKGRLEARMQILEEHNRQLEAQLQRLRRLLDEVGPFIQLPGPLHVMLLIVVINFWTRSSVIGLVHQDPLSDQDKKKWNYPSFFAWGSLWPLHRILQVYVVKSSYV